MSVGEVNLVGARVFVEDFAARFLRDFIEHHRVGAEPQILGRVRDDEASLRPGCAIPRLADGHHLIPPGSPEWKGRLVSTRSDLPQGDRF